MKKYLSILSFMVLCCVNVVAATTDSIRFHDFDTDTARIAQLLRATHDKAMPLVADRVAFVAGQLVGTPYEAGTLEGDEELLTINTSALDCTTLVETAIALAQAAATDTATVNDFAACLRNIRYRDGVVDGYASRLHYASDWVADNEYRGTFTEVTPTFRGSEMTEKRINFMTANRKAYPALQHNDSLFEAMMMVESLYENYRYCYIPKMQFSYQYMQRLLRNGDVLLFTTSIRGLDVQHMGIVVVINDTPYLLHASSRAQKVVLEQRSIYEYLRSNNSLTGVRVIRL